MDIRVGHGYDAHRLKPGRRLILGGVEFVSPLGLDGHSDADVLCHAIIDALLGAAAMGDIGALFPDSDAAYKDADSVGLLRETATLLGKSGYAASNIDATVVAQEPRLIGHIPAMRENIARALRIDPGRVSVKATTEEKMGFTGALEGISAHAVVLIEKNESAV